ncbi:DegV family protein [Levilactobacillus tangyuanensis]|uniref:DegV family protein n=1 Tax=Levilactobacillus tangyuanensis TaxID=2486021 RepID=A0ABW1TKY6_9LACO|nr:DegV family protein [Levilactobacillus tangyuanensis]
MKIAILTDTSAGIDFDEATERQITLLPAPIMFGNRQYHEYQDLSTADYYRLVRLSKGEKMIPTAPQISMQTIAATCDDLAKQGVTDVIIIGPSQGISGFVNTLGAFTENVTSVKIWPWDSRGVLTPMGEQARLAAALVAKGFDVPTILERLAALRATCQLGFVVDSIKPLLRTGDLNLSRGPANAQLLAGKPLLVFEASGKVRVAGSSLRMKSGWHDLFDRLTASLKGHPATQLTVTVLNADQPELTQQWLAWAQAELPAVTLKSATIGPSFGVHVGDGAMGLAWNADYRQFLNLDNEK